MIATDSQLPTPVPTTVAITVVSPIMPLADEILLGRSISGMLPSLAGPNSAAWEPISATTRTSNTCCRSESRRSPAP